MGDVGVWGAAVAMAACRGVGGPLLLSILRVLDDEGLQGFLIAGRLVGDRRRREGEREDGERRRLVRVQHRLRHTVRFPL